MRSEVISHSKNDQMMRLALELVNTELKRKVTIPALTGSELKQLMMWLKALK